MNSPSKGLMTRILVGYLGLYPTLLLVLTLSQLLSIKVSR